MSINPRSHFHQIINAAVRLKCDQLGIAEAGTQASVAVAMAAYRRGDSTASAIAQGEANARDLARVQERGIVRMGGQVEEAPTEAVCASEPALELQEPPPPTDALPTFLQRVLKVLATGNAFTVDQVLEHMNLRVGRRPELLRALSKLSVRQLANKHVIEGEPVMFSLSRHKPARLRSTRSIERARP